MKKIFTILSLLAITTVAFAETDYAAMKEIARIKNGKAPLSTPALGTIASGVGTALTALNGENIQDDTIDDDSIDFADVTLDDFSGALGAVDAGSVTNINGENIQDDTIDDDSIDFADVTGADLDLSDCGYINSSATVADGVSSLVGVPITIRFDPVTAGAILTNSYTVPTGYDLLVLNAYGWKTDAAAAAGDTWDLKNNDGSAANIFDQEDIGTATLADKAFAQFDNLDDAEAEIEAGNTLEFISTETANDDGAEGIVVVEGILKIAD